MNNLILRKAVISDVTPIHKTLLSNAQNGLLLPRPLGDLYNKIREFYVFEDELQKKVVGFCALSIIWEDIAEIRSLVVLEEQRGKHLGKKLVEKCLEEAKNLNIYKVFTLTYQDGFFNKLGFKVIEKDMLPNKIWADCIHCPKFPDCDEIAMLIEL